MMDESRLKEIVYELKEDNMASFDELYSLTKKVIFYNIFSFVKNYESSEDLLQDTYVNFLKNIKNFKEKESVLAYLMVISKNLAINFLKKESKKSDYSEHESKLSEIDERRSDEEILLNKIKNIINKKEYRVFILHAYNDFTFDEISKLDKTPLGTILFRYNSAIKKLKKELVL